MKRLILAASLFCFAIALNAQTKPPVVTNPTIAKKATVTTPRLVEITTTFGTIVVKLYDSTPLHRDNFVKLVKEKFYDSLLFHRVIDGFMIQGGDPNSKNAPLDTVQLGNGEVPGVDRIPAEFKTFLYHKRGALAMARDDNPEKASSNCQFYIVQGKQFTDVQLNGIECQVRGNNPAFTYTDAQRKVYKTIGGAPFLDQNYTVFGEVIKGMEVVDKIAKAARDGNDRPLQNIMMKMRMLN
jgi:peptidyl-prolyl cis-trans isomerase B (cyclophilin B)